MIKPILLSKLKATGLHFSISLAAMLLSAFLVFGMWYPGLLAVICGVSYIFLLIVIVELCLGPLMSMVIFNPAKPRKELIRDYSLVAVIQVAGLLYGMNTLFESRPIFEVLSVDRVEIITSNELKPEFMEGAPPPFTKRSLTGPIRVCADMPFDPIERSNLLQSALAGRDVELYPKYYRECGSSEIWEAAAVRSTLDTVMALFDDEERERAVAQLPSGDDYRWMPIRSRFGAWVGVVNDDNSTYTYTPVNITEVW
jgi:hypothetical protein